MKTENMPWKDYTYRYFEEDNFIKYVLEYCAEYGFRKVDVEYLKNQLECDRGEMTYKIVMRDTYNISEQNHINIIFIISGLFILYSYFDPIGARSYLVAVFDENNLVEE